MPPGQLCWVTDGMPTAPARAVVSQIERRCSVGCIVALAHALATLATCRPAKLAMSNVKLLQGARCLSAQLTFALYWVQKIVLW